MNTLPPPSKLDVAVDVRRAARHREPVLGEGLHARRSISASWMRILRVEGAALRIDAGARDAGTAPCRTRGSCPPTKAVTSRCLRHAAGCAVRLSRSARMPQSTSTRPQFDRKRSVLAVRHAGGERTAGSRGPPTARDPWPAARATSQPWPKPATHDELAGLRRLERARRAAAAGAATPVSPHSACRSVGDGTRRECRRPWRRRVAKRCGPCTTQVPRRRAASIEPSAACDRARHQREVALVADPAFFVARNRSRVGRCAIVIDEVRAQRSVARQYSAASVGSGADQHARRRRGRSAAPVRCRPWRRAASAATTRVVLPSREQRSASSSAATPARWCPAQSPCAALPAGRAPSATTPALQRSANGCVVEANASDGDGAAVAAPARQSRAASTAMVRLSSSQLHSSCARPAALPARRPVAQAVASAIAARSRRRRGRYAPKLRMPVPMHRRVSSRSTARSSGVHAQCARARRCPRARCDGRVLRASGRCGAPGS